MTKKDLLCLPILLLLTAIPLSTVDPALSRAADSGASATGAEDAATTVPDAPPRPAQLDGDFKSAIVVDADTGEVLVASNPRRRSQPASMLKMMTELIVLERIAEGDLALDDTTEVSAKASRMGGSQVYLKHGEVFTIEELLGALAIHSANDAAVCLAEHVAGSTEAFIDLMNLRARELGMNDTEFHTVHGLPPEWNQQPDLTTAYDLTLLGRELVEYPQALDWSATATAPFRDGEFIMYNPNKLVGKFRGLDGLKTGFHGRSGFCVTATAIQKGKRLISVVMGCSTDRSRATETTRLMSYGFNLYTKTELVAEPMQMLTQPYPVKGGKKKAIDLAYAKPLALSVLKDRISEVRLQPDLPEKLAAPITEGDVVGRAVAVLDGHELGSVAIVATETVEKGNWLDRLFH